MNNANKLTATKLIEILQKFPPDTEILVYDDGDSGYGALMGTPGIYMHHKEKQIVLSQYYPNGCDDVYETCYKLMEETSEKKDETNTN